MLHRIWLIILFLFSTLYANTHIEIGETWLIQSINQKQIDINSSKLALPVQVSKESLEILTSGQKISQLNESFILSPFEKSADFNTTEYLSNHIASFLLYDKNVSALVSKLHSLQNSDGGFGHTNGYQSTSLDTAIALEALYRAKVDGTIIQKAISYLLSKQSPNGSWVDLVDDQSIYTTATVLRSLWLHLKNYNLQDYLDKGKNYLLSQKNIDGSYGELFESGLVLRSIAPMEYNKSNLQSSIDYLESMQQFNGSWGEDLFTTALVLQALFLADKDVPNPDLGSLSGIIVDGDSGVALSGIDVELEGIESKATNNNGKFIFTGLQNGAYKLNITSVNHAPLSASVQMNGDDINLGTLRLNKNIDATISTLQGKITDAASGEALEGVKVIIGQKETYTDSNGNYTIDSIEAGEYTLIIQKTGYLQENKSISVPANAMLYFNATLRTVDFEIEAMVKGMIVDANTQQPLEGVDVELKGTMVKNINTANDGKFLFSKIKTGEYQVLISLEGYKTQMATFQINETVVIDFGIIALEPSEPNETTMTLKGTIVEKVSKIPIEGVLVQANGIQTYTDDNGFYEINNLDENNPLSVEVSKDGYKTIVAQTSGVAGAIIAFSPTLEKIDTELAIFGTILDANSSEPLSNVIVIYAGEQNISVSSDENGYYILSPIASGDAKLVYSKLGYETVAFSVNIENKSINVSPSLKTIDKKKPDNDAVINGIILDSTTNNPIPGVMIQLTGAFTNENIISDFDGKFEIGDIKSYDVNISFSHDEYKGVQTSIWLTRDENMDMGQVRMRPISADILLPDLSVIEIDTTGMLINQNELLLDGSIGLKIINKGTLETESDFSVLAFYDKNKDGNYTKNIDYFLGEQEIIDSLGIDENTTFSIPLSGKLPFVNAPISILIDSKMQIIESDETNNLVKSSDKCMINPSTNIGQFNPVVKWHWKGDSSSSYADWINPYSAPVVVPLEDTNGDGKVNNLDIPAIVIHTHRRNNTSKGSVMRAISGLDGRELWTMDDYILSYSTDLAAADIDSDGFIEIIAQANDGRLIIVSHDGEVKLIGNDIIGLKNSSLSIANIDNSGSPEIIFGNYVFNSDLQLLWHGDKGSGVNKYSSHAISIVADINMDGFMEIIAGSTVYDRNGNVLWQANINDGYTGIGNFNSDKYPEIVLVAHGKVYLLSHNGDILWGPVSIPGGGGPGGGGAPTIGDMDGDDEPEIGIAGAYYYVVLEADGSIKWQSKIKDYSSAITGSSVFDFEGDGKKEIIYADEDYLRIYDGQTGDILYQYKNSSGTAKELPVVVDADIDGSADIIFISNQYSTNVSFGVKMISCANNSWMPTRSIWNQHSYHIDNINDDGTIPQVEEPSWLSHNTYRLNTFTDRDARAIPDLSVSSLKLVEGDNGLSAHVRVGNGGSDELRKPTLVSFYDGNPLDDGVLIGSEEILALDYGEYIDIVFELASSPKNERFYAAVDPHNVIQECDENNNQMSILASASKIYGKISVSTDMPSYSANQIIILSAVGTNLGKLDTELSARLIIEDVSGVIVETFPSVYLGTVASGDSRTISETWNSGTTLSGEYVLRGILYDTQGNVVDESLASFLITNGEAGIAEASLDLSTDKRRYHTSDSVIINNFIQNLSPNSIIPDATIALQIMDSNKTIVNSQSLQLSDLLPTSSREANAYYEFTRAPVGNYMIEAKLIDGGGNVYDMDAALFEVYEDFAQSLRGSVSVAWNSELAGTEQVCSYKVTNFGSATLNELPLELRVVNLNEPSTLEIFASSESLESMHSVEATQAFTTNGYKADEYSCALYAKTGDTWMHLDNKQFTVEVPPVNIDGFLKQEGNGRLLILLDPSDDYSHCNKPCKPWNELCKSNENSNISPQREYLESLLDTNGYSYTIVTDNASFTNELRRGVYNTYALLSEKVKLSHTIQSELTEAVFKGEGLIVSGVHDSRNHFVYEALGVKLVGLHTGVDGIETIAPEYSNFEALFSSDAKTVSFKTEDTQLLANYTTISSTQYSKWDKHKCNDFIYPAAVKYHFGGGESIFMGFDILAEAANQPKGNYEILFLEALTDIYNNSTPILTGDIVPMTLEIINTGIAVPIRVDLNITENGQFIGALNEDSMTSNSLGFTEEILSENETKTYNFWVQALQPQSEMELKADIFSLHDGKEEMQVELNYSASIGSVQSMDAICLYADQIYMSNWRDQYRLKHAISNLRHAQNYIAIAYYDHGLFWLLKATDNLQSIGEKELVKELRIMIDQKIREIEIKINAGEK